MKFKDLCSGNKKNVIIGALWLLTFFLLLPNFVQVVSFEMAPYTENEVVITNVSYKATLDGKENIITAQLFQPSPKFGNQTYPAIIACHGWLFGLGKESMHRWSVEIAKRDFVVMAIDLPGHGMTLGEMDILPNDLINPYAIEAGITYLKSLEFVDGSAIGLIGISLGGGTVSMASGVLGDLVQATISLNGYVNFTDCLINGLLPDLDIEFTVDKDYITLEKAGKVDVTPENIVEILEIYKLYKGSDEALQDLIVPGTTKLSKVFLKQFDAVEHLANARDDSVLFLHSKRDGTFYYTNQSWQGYEAITKAGKKAYYVSVDDDHQLMGDPDYTSDYVIINFFEEKLKGVDLGSSWSNYREKYVQKRDIVLTISHEFNFTLAYIEIGLFFISIIPFFVIVNIIFYNKKFATERAELEEAITIEKKKTTLYYDFSFGRGSYAKTIIFLAVLYLITYIALFTIPLGYASEIMAGFLGVAFYFVLYLTMYFLPDQAEADLKKRLKGKENPYAGEPAKTTKVFDVNAIYPLLVMLAVVVGIGFIGFFISPLPGVFSIPIEQIITPMLFMGIALVVFGIIFIIILEKQEYEGITVKQINWGLYTLDNYQILKGFTFGSVLFLNFMFQWNIWAFYMKFPMTMGPHSLYYLYMIIASALFFAGIQLFIKIMKEKVLKDNIETERSTVKKILIELLGTLFGLVMIIIIGYIAFVPLLSFSLLPDLTWGLVLIIAVIFLLIAVIKIFCTDRSILGYTIFLPICIFSVLAFFLHV